MFKFLKDKLKSAISKISEGVEKEGKVEEKIIENKNVQQNAKSFSEEKGFFAKIKEKLTGRGEEKEIAEGKKQEKVEIKEDVSHAKEKK